MLVADVFFLSGAGGARRSFRSAEKSRAKKIPGNIKEAPHSQLRAHDTWPAQETRRESWAATPLSSGAALRGSRPLRHSALRFSRFFSSGASFPPREGRLFSRAKRHVPSRLLQHLFSAALLLRRHLQPPRDPRGNPRTFYRTKPSFTRRASTSITRSNAKNRAKHIV